MVADTDCPLCEGTFEQESDLRVHLEVEHRKSELARFIVDRPEAVGDPIAEGETLVQRA